MPAHRGPFETRARGAFGSANGKYSNSPGPETRAGSGALWPAVIYLHDATDTAQPPWIIIKIGYTRLERAAGIYFHVYKSRRANSEASGDVFD